MYKTEETFLNKLYRAGVIESSFTDGLGPSSFGASTELVLCKYHCVSTKLVGYERESLRYFIL